MRLSRNLAPAIALFAAATCAATPPADHDLHNRPYVLVADPRAPGAQTLDLLLPERAGKVPLLVLIAHEQWHPPAASHLPAHEIARAFRESGVAVAVVRHRVGPRFRQDAAIEDLASALRFLENGAGDWGIDTGRVYLMGYFAGAFNALDLVLSKKPRVAGIIAINGVFELERKYENLPAWRRAIDAAFGPGVAARRAHAPRQRVRAGFPPLLLLNAAAPGVGQLNEAWDLVLALRHAGNQVTEFFPMPGRDRSSILEFGGSENLLREIVLSFMGAPAGDPALRSNVDLRRRWQNPPFDSREFWERGAQKVRSHAVTAAFRADLKQALERFAAEEFANTPLERYHAIDLADWLALPGAATGVGDFLTTTNVRGERFYLSADQIRKYRPQLVIGIDEERNLFRFLAFYQTRRQYSWQDAPETRRSARPLGAFLHFPGDTPLSLKTTGIARFGLVAGGFSLRHDDPFATLEGLPEPVRGALYYRNGCVSCHSFRAFSARSHHITATAGETQGGFALPLNGYRDDVLKRFFFAPREAARIIGVEPNIVADDAADDLYRVIREAREP